MTEPKKDVKKRDTRTVDRRMRIYRPSELVTLIRRLPPDDVVALAKLIRSEIPVAAGLMWEAMRQAAQPPQPRELPSPAVEAPQAPQVPPNDPRRAQEALRARAQQRAAQAAQGGQ